MTRHTPAFQALKLGSESYNRPKNVLAAVLMTSRSVYGYRSMSRTHRLRKLGLSNEGPPAAVSAAPQAHKTAPSVTREAISWNKPS
jgi:hypothetical protein